MMQNRKERVHRDEIEVTQIVASNNESKNNFGAKKYNTRIIEKVNEKEMKERLGRR